ncbi:MAG TPA: hypothetical protein VGP64_07745 [Polyangia bacterium]|jgi:hypothetical protein
MLKLYARLAGKSIRLALRGWPAVVAIPAYTVVLLVAFQLLGGLGPATPFLLGIVLAFLVSSYLHLVWMAVGGRKIGLGDIRDSFLAHFWDVVGVEFATWMIGLVVGFGTQGLGDRGHALAVLADLLMVVFFNPVPEVIYLGGERARSFGLFSFGTLIESGRFISAHWIEWLAPNVLIAAALLAPIGALHHQPLAERLLAFQSFFSLAGLANTILTYPRWLIPFVLLFVNWAMVFRGLLFDELTSRVRRPRPWP